MKLPLLMILSAVCVLPAAAQDNRWVTFKTVRDNWGKAEHQIDRTTIRQEGPYRVFWTRIWLPASKQPLAVSSSQQPLLRQSLFVHHRLRGVGTTNPHHLLLHLLEFAVGSILPLIVGRAISIESCE